MASLNRVVLIGNLTKDPEVKYRPDGTAVTDLRLAVNETFRNRQTGESVEKTCFVDVVVWARQAENCGKYLSKGSPVLVEGGLQMDEWEAQDGGKRSRLRVRARNVQFLSSPRNAEFRDGPAGGGREPAVDVANSQGAAPDAAGADDENLPF